MTQLFCQVMTERLTERFVGLYQVKAIILTNAIELVLLNIVKIYPVVNISRVCKYKNQVEGQKKKYLTPVIIKEKEKYKVEKILNKRKFRGKNRYLVQQKEYMAEKDTQKLNKNLGNVQELVERFEEEHSKRVRQVKKDNIRKSREGELLGKYIAKLLYE